MNIFKDRIRGLLAELAADVVRGAVDVAFAKGEEILARGAAARATEDQAPIEPSEMPLGSRLSRRRCPACGGALFFRVVQPEEGYPRVWYWCRGACGYGKFESRSEATRFEGIPL